jgi:hypothetical protein
MEQPSNLENRIRPKNIILPFKVLVSPLKTFAQLVQEPVRIGLIPLILLLPVLAAGVQYVSATRIILLINNQSTSLASAPFFANWFTNQFALTMLTIILFWLVFATSLALISPIFKGKQISFRALYIILGYLLTVFLILYAVRILVYSLLPSIRFDFLSSWPPSSQSDIDAVNKLVTDNWGSNIVFEFGNIFTLIAFMWLIMLGSVAIRAVREISWQKAFLVSLVGAILSFLLLGPP